MLTNYMQYTIALSIILALSMFMFIPNIAIADSEWKIYKLNQMDQVFKIPYKITHGELKNIEKDQRFYDMILYIENDSINDGKIEVTMPRNLIDPKIGHRDDTFTVLVDGNEVRYDEVSNSPCFRTLSIKFSSASKTIEIVAALPLSGEISSSAKTEVPPVYVTTDEHNYEPNGVIRFSGCTDLALDDKEVILKVLNPLGEVYRTISVTPHTDGSFLTSLTVEGEDVINGTYTANATYAGHSATSSFVVPEFPVSILIASIAMGSILAIIRVKAK